MNGRPSLLSEAALRLLGTLTPERLPITGSLRAHPVVQEVELADLVVIEWRAEAWTIRLSPTGRAWCPRMNN